MMTLKRSAVEDLADLWEQRGETHAIKNNEGGLDFFPLLTKSARAAAKAELEQDDRIIDVSFANVDISHIKEGLEVFDKAFQIIPQVKPMQRIYLPSKMVPNPLACLPVTKRRNSSKQDSKLNETDVVSIVQPHQQVDFKLLECNFIKFNPDTVIAIDFCKKEKLLAVARFGCDIQLMSVGKSLKPMMIIPGKRYLDVEFNADKHKFVKSKFFGAITKVRFVESDKYKTRLFASTEEGTLLEVDIENVGWRREVQVSGGKIFDFHVLLKTNQLIAATEDGFLRVYSLFDDAGDDCLEFSRLIKTSQPGPILAIAIAHSEDFAFLGGKDGRIRKLQLETMRVEAVIELTTKSKEHQNGHDRIVAEVKCIVVLTSGTVVVGDSQGNVHFLDEFGVIISSSSVHKGAVLSLAVDEPESSVYSSAEDGTIALHCCRQNQNTVSEWSFNIKKKTHANSVTCIVTGQMDEKRALFSGGLDAMICTIPISSTHEFRSAKVTSFAPWFSDRNIISMTKELQTRSKTIIVSVKQSRILELYMVPFDPNLAFGMPTKDDRHELLASFSFRRDSRIIASDITYNLPDGRLLAVLVDKTVKLFALSDNMEDFTKPVFIPIPSEWLMKLNDPILIDDFIDLKFASTNGKTFLWVLSTTGAISAFNVTGLTKSIESHSKFEIELAHEAQFPNASGPRNSIDWPYTTFSVAGNDDHMHLVSVHGQREIALATFKTEAGKKAKSIISIIPQTLFSLSPVICADFADDSCDTLVILCDDNIFYEINIDVKTMEISLSKWSSSGGEGHISKFPNILQSKQPTVAVHSSHGLFAVFGPEGVAVVDSTKSLNLSNQTKTRKVATGEFKPEQDEILGVRFLDNLEPVVAARFVGNTTPLQKPILLVFEAPSEIVAAALPPFKYISTFGGSS